VTPGLENHDIVDGLHHRGRHKQRCGWALEADYLATTGADYPATVGEDFLATVAVQDSICLDPYCPRLSKYHATNYCHANQLSTHHASCLREHQLQYLHEVTCDKQTSTLKAIINYVAQ
jgi:hypothetical protein